MNDATHGSRIVAELVRRFPFLVVDELQDTGYFVGKSILVLIAKEKLNALGANGKISIDEESTLEVLVNAGGAAAHRGWRPKTEELNTMVDVLESFLHRSFIVGGRDSAPQSYGASEAEALKT